MQKVVGSSPIIRFPEKARSRGLFLCSLPAAVVVVAAVLAGGYPVLVYSLLCAAVWFGLAFATVFPSLPRPSAAVLALAALAALTLVSGLWGRAAEAADAAPLVALYAGLLYAAEWAGAGLASLRLAIVALAAAGIAGRATGLAAPSPEPGSVRMAWPVTYANGLGLLCAMGVVLCVGLRPRWLLGAGVCATALVWTLSRSAILACLASLVLLALLRGRVSWRIAAAGAVCLAVAAILLARPVYERFQAPVPDSRGVQRLTTVSGHGRTTLWRTALAEGRDHPLAGGGAGSWRRFAVADTGRRNLPANG